MVYLRTNAGTNGSTMISSLITILHLLKNFTLIPPDRQRFPFFLQILQILNSKKPVVGWVGLLVRYFGKDNRSNRNCRYPRSTNSNMLARHQAEAVALYALVNSMTAAIRSPDSRRPRTARKPARAPANAKVTSISRARRAKTGPQLPDYPPSEAVQARPQLPDIKVLPDPQWQPAWLRSLLRVQRVSSAAAFLLVGGALTLYGLTVYGEQQWSQEYQKLENLRLSEQQLTAASEVMKHQLAKEAQNPQTGLAPQNPSDMIFLEQAPESRSPQATVLPNPDPAIENQADTQTPLGY